MTAQGKPQKLTGKDGSTMLAVVKYHTNCFTSHHALCGDYKHGDSEKMLYPIEQMSAAYDNSDVSCVGCLQALRSGTR